MSGNKKRKNVFREFFRVLKFFSVLSLIIPTSTFSASNKNIGKRELVYKTNQKQTVPPVKVDSECWATIYEGENFTGRSLTLDGEIYTRNLDEGPVQFEQRIGSVKTGDKSELRLYGNKNLKDRDHRIPPNTTVPVLEKVPAEDDIDSLALICKDSKIHKLRGSPSYIY